VEYRVNGPVDSRTGGPADSRNWGRSLCTRTVCVANLKCLASPIPETGESSQTGNMQRIPNLSFLSQFILEIAGGSKSGAQIRLRVMLGSWKSITDFLEESFLLLVFSRNHRPTMHRLVTIHRRDPATTNEPVSE